MSSQTPIDILPESVKQTLDTDPASITLLDCREPDEWAFNRVNGAVHIPMQQTPDRIDELPRDKPVVVYCHHGVRSRQVAQFLRAHGYAARSLAGGIDQWSQQIDPTCPRY